MEDKLQEGVSPVWWHHMQVRDTLVAMAAAGISVWILTGDKKETAINISYACGHLQPGMAVRSPSLNFFSCSWFYCFYSSYSQVLDVTGQTNMTITGKLRGYADQIATIEEVFGLVVDGAALTLIMPVEENKELLYLVRRSSRRHNTSCNVLLYNCKTDKPAGGLAL